MVVQLNAKTFFERLAKLYSSWEKEGDYWDEIDALEISVGRVTEDIPEYQKCTTMQTWLLGYEFTDTIIIFCEKKVIFLTSSKKGDFLQTLMPPPADCKVEVSVLLKHDIKAGNENDENFATLIAEVKRSKRGSKIGVLQREIESQIGTFTPIWYKKLEQSGLEFIEANAALSDLLSVKDAEEVTLVKKAGLFSSKVLKKYLQNEMETIIDEGQVIQHSKLAEKTEEVLMDPSKAKNLPKLKSDSLDICFPPIIQSGGVYNLGLYNNTLSTDANLHFGTIIACLGAKYKSYCCTIGRTYMIDCPKEEENNYNLLLEVHDLVIKLLRPGVKLGDVYDAAVGHISKKNPALLPNFTKTCGWGVGIERREEFLNIARNNSVQVKPNMTFVVAVGFDKIENPTAKDELRRIYSLFLADTVAVLADKTEVYSDCEKKYDDVSYSLDENDADASEVRRPQTRGEKGTVKNVEEERKKQQQDLLRRKQEESRQKARLGTEKKSEDVSMDAQLARGKIWSYRTAKEFPKGLRHNKIHVDQNRETVLIPINGVHVPFHITTIKSASKSEEGVLRINFKNPGQSFGGAYAAASMFPTATFLKEISYRSKDAKNIGNLLRAIQDLSKRIKTRETERKEKADLVAQEPIQLEKGASVPRLRSVSVRPYPKGKKTSGTLEAHQNGLRFQCGAEDVEILYSNIRHAFYQAAGKDTLVLIHFHLRNPIMVGKKKHNDIQFYTEVTEDDQLVGRFRRNITDQESIEEEDRERLMKQKLNKEFHSFAKRVEEKSGIEFDIPYRELEFTGTPFRSSVTIVPTVNCLVSLSEQPFFVVTLDDVELAHFERVSFGLKNFDLVFVFKNYSRAVVQINSIPVVALDMLKDWLTQVKIKYFEGPASLVWTKIMKTVKEDEANGTWDPWGPDGWNSFLNMDDAEDQDGSDPEDKEDAYEPSDSEEADNSDAESASDSDVSLASENSDGPSEPEDEEEGMDWAELENEARESDKRGGKDWSDEEEERPKKRAPAPTGGRKAPAPAAGGRKAPPPPAGRRAPAPAAGGRKAAPAPPAKRQRTM